MKLRSRKNTAQKSPSLSRVSVKITACVFHTNMQESQYRVRFRRIDGTMGTIYIPREKFHQNPKDVVAILFNAHALLPDDKVNALEIVETALHQRSEKNYNMTNRPGWNGRSFVYPGSTVGPLKGKLVHDRRAGINPVFGLKAGTAEAWRDGLMQACTFSDYLVLAASVPAAGPLLEIIGGGTSAVFHLHGTKSAFTTAGTKTKSSSGKSLATRVAASQIGRCEPNDIITFAMTARSLEDYCFAHNDLAVVFDEEGRTLGGGKGKKIDRNDFPHVVSSGRGTLRSKKAIQDRDLENLTWSVFAVSNGEEPLDDSGAKTARGEGTQVRMLPLPVPAGRYGGIFNLVKGTEEERLLRCKKLARKVEATIRNNYGVVMPEFLKRLVPQRATLAPKIRKTVDDFVRSVCGNADPWECRYAEKFGIVLAGAILLSSFDLAPWTEQRARAAIERMYRTSRATTVSIGEATDTLVAGLRKPVATGQRFAAVAKGQVVSPKQSATLWGVIRDFRRHKNVALIPYARFKHLVKPSAAASHVLSELGRRGVLVKGSDGKNTRQVLIKGFAGNTRARYVCLVGLAKPKRSLP